MPETDTDPVLPESPPENQPPIEPGAATSPGSDVVDVVIPEALLALDETLVTTVVCPTCTTKASWKGAFTHDMIARTFTRGFGRGDYPLCPRCGTGMAILEETAIEEAARDLPERTVPRQPAIPGLTPPFDKASAFDSIIAKRRDVRQLEAIADKDHKTAGRSKKAADEGQAELSKLEDDFEQRCQEIMFEQRDRAARADDPSAIGICAYERTTGNRCVICRTYGPEGNAEADHHVASSAAQDPTLTNGQVVALLADVGHVDIELARVGEWTPEERATVLAWLKAPEMDTMPSALFLEPPDRDSDHELQHLLARAGAIVSLDAIAAWKSKQVNEASAWARKSIKANERCEAGHHISVAWPQHVSDAHHADDPEPARAPMKRHRSPASAKAAKQAAEKRAKKPAKRGRR